MGTEKVFQKVQVWVLYALVFLLPFTILTISSSPFTISKLAILTFFVILLIVLVGLRSIITGKFSFGSSSYDLPVIIIALAYIASTILRTPNKMEALLLPGTTTAVVGGAILYFLLNQLKDKSGITKVLIFSGAVYSLFTLLAFTGLLGKIPQLPAFMRAKAFSPEGGYLPSAIFLLTLLPLSIGAIISEKEVRSRLANIVATLIILPALALSIYNIFPGSIYQPKFPSLQTSWEISIDSLKTSPFLGIGPGNYMTAFNRFRPLSYNASDIWAVKYSTASNFYLTLFTETGLLGVAGILILLWVFIKDAKKQVKEHKLVNWGVSSVAPILSMSLLLLLLAACPATVLIIVLLFITLSFVAKTHVSLVNLSIQKVKEGSDGQIVSSRLLAILVITPLLAVTLYGGYLGFNILRAEFYYKEALESLLANDAQETFNNMRKAVQLNPRVDRYRATFSRINLILADATARKKDLTDNDRTTITQLIQAAIAEAKASVALNPQRAQNWEVLGRTYQSIIPLANGADAFAAESYSQAIALDPINPTTRIALGGLYYASANYEVSTRIFELAVTSKPDLANGHFNLAFSYKEAGKLDQAIQQMGLVLGLVKPDTQDYEVAKKALEDFQTKKKSVAASSENLTPPSANPTPALKPKVELPEGSEPPTEVVTPTPSAIPTSE